MGNHPGIYVRGATTALTRRTTYRKSFWAPWHEQVEPIWLYSLADAQRKAGVAIHPSHLVINHEHTRATPSSGNLGKFQELYRGDMSSALNALLAREGYDQPRQGWDTQRPHKMRLLDAEAMMSTPTYDCLNWQAAGLVARRSHFPMRGLDHHYWKAGGLEVELPEVMFDGSKRADKLWLELTPDPELYRLFDGDLDALIHHLDRLVEHGRQQIALARKGRPVMGAQAIRRLHPWSEPKTLRETGGQLRPTYKAGARGLVGRVLNRAAAKDTTRFRGEAREARIAQLHGDLDHAYPYGVYAAHVFQGAPMVPCPHPDAVARPRAQPRSDRCARDVLGPEHHVELGLDALQGDGSGPA